jgi:hypothetical protein
LPKAAQKADININVIRVFSKIEIRKSFAKNPYETKEKTVTYCFNLGRQIIDGEVEGYTVEE